ncbi:MAG: hypothetical protein LC105_08945 [Chitinophagales bacterium]|nr:hypothetical protein [Chitinophagales bacterium]
MKTNFYQRFLEQTLFYRKRSSEFISGTILYLGIVFFLVFLYDLGFGQNILEEQYLRNFYRIVKWFLVSVFLGRNLLNIFNDSKSLRIKILDFFILIILIFLTQLYVQESLFSLYLPSLPSYKYLVTPIFSLIFFIEFSRNAVSYYSPRLNPALILVLSFVLIVFIGTILLSLPNSSYRHLSFIDTLFTATGAVCVTGLTVIDISKDLTLLGQIIILILIQIGGLGIMTFASFIGFMFSGSNVSFQQRLLLREIANSQRMNDVIGAVYKIMAMMLTLEFIGAFMIYQLVPNNLFENHFDHLFFSIFHSISAFCNSGFSNFPEGLQHVDLRFQPLFLLNMSFLIILGGIGFPIMLNFYEYIHLQLKNIWNYVIHKKRFVYVPYLFNLNSRIILVVTGWLLLLGTIGVFVFEYNGVLSEFSLFEKIVVSFFTSATTRTAGFSAVELSSIHFPTYILVVILMWIGASPGSTGGGIKTTTFAVMVLNFFSLSKGENYLIVQNRRITPYSINKSFAIITLSLLLIGMAVSLISYFDPQFTLEQIVFESFSAFSTAGLTQGITKGLSGESKTILIILMLIGRVGAIVFLSAFIRNPRTHLVKYPQQEIQF